MKKLLAIFTAATLACGMVNAQKFTVVKCQYLSITY